MVFSKFVDTVLVSRVLEKTSQIGVFRGWLWTLFAGKVEETVGGTRMANFVHHFTFYKLSVFIQNLAFTHVLIFAILSDIIRL